MQVYCNPTRSKHANLSCKSLAYYFTLCYFLSLTKKNNLKISFNIPVLRGSRYITRYIFSNQRFKSCFVIAAYANYFELTRDKNSLIYNYCHYWYKEFNNIIILGGVSLKIFHSVLKYVTQIILFKFLIGKQV